MVGYFEQNFMTTFYWWFGASIVAAVLTIPSWLCLFRRQKIKWADVDEIAAETELEEEAEAAAAGKKKGKKLA